MKPEKLEAIGYERKQSTKKDKQKFIKKYFPKPMRTNIMKVADLIRVLNFFVLDMGDLYEMITLLDPINQKNYLILLK